MQLSQSIPNASSKVSDISLNDSVEQKTPHVAQGVVSFEEQKILLQEIAADIFDVCVVGSGVEALPLCERLYQAGKKVLFVAPDEPHLAGRAFIKATQLSAAPSQPPAPVDQVADVAAEVQAKEASSTPLSAFYFDARSAKRFKAYAAVKKEFGPQEELFFAEKIALPLEQKYDDHTSHVQERALGAYRKIMQTLAQDLPSVVIERGYSADAADQQHAEASLGRADVSDMGDMPNNASALTATTTSAKWLALAGAVLESVVAAPNLEAVQSINVVCHKPHDEPLDQKKPQHIKRRISKIINIKAKEFHFVMPLEEWTRALSFDLVPEDLKPQVDAFNNAFLAPLRTVTAQSGYTLTYKHTADYTGFPDDWSAWLVVPVIASAEKQDRSHVVGRFFKNPLTQELESYWISLLSDDQVEDNNEILKKIKQAKRAIERALPGFVESIVSESVGFEPRLFVRSKTGTAKKTSKTTELAPLSQSSDAILNTFFYI